MALSPYLEDLDSQIPAVQMLCALGWQYLSREEALAKRGGRQDHVVLTEVLRPWMAAHNLIETRGQSLRFTETQINEAIRRLTEEPYDGLVRTNEKVYHLLTLGTSVDVEVDGDRKGRDVRFISWDKPGENVYHVTTEFAVERSKSHETCRPDLVLFVNGIPVVVIECKRRDQDGDVGDKAIERAVKQVITYQKDDHIPHLFQFTQLVLGTSVNACRYGTVGTALKFWCVWKEEGKHEQAVHAAANQALAPAVEAKLFVPPDHDQADAYREARLWWQQRAAAGDRLPTEQDRTLWAMLRPDRLIAFMRDAVVFDAGIRKVARYQQWFAVQATVARVTGVHEGKREGGVIWHTTGSGKSLTMVMLAKALALCPDITNPRVVLVTDREDLDIQLSRTFDACGKTTERARTGEHLAKLIKEGQASVITAIINKFASVMDKNQAQDLSSNIFVMVDEGHRSNYGGFAAKMRRVFPNACYIAFTGTPLLKKDKLTAQKFGGFIHSYTMRQAVADEAVVPLVYEGRMALLEQNEHALDQWFERLTETLSEKQKADLKRTIARKEVINQAEQRVRLIAFDISRHFQANFAGRGLKGQVAADSRTSAIRYRKFLQEFGEVRAEVIMSAPDIRGEDETVEEDESLISQFWAEMMKRYGTEDAYNRQIKASFGQEDGDVELIIVVDKLLTGFDEPRNAVLYIDKSLKAHSILQAIARVNRLFSGKDHGLIVDYRGILGHLNEAMQIYEALAGFDPEDVDLTGTVVDVSTIIADLPQHHSDVWAVFKEVANKLDNEAMERHLAPEDRREGFYGTLRVFQKTLATALASERVYELVPRDRLETFKRDFKFFIGLRTSVQSRYADRVDYSQYEKQIRKLLDTHIQAPEVRIITPEFSIFEPQALENEVKQHTSAASQADTIASRVAKTCREKMEENTAFYERFAKLVQKVIDDYRQGRISELEYLKKSEEILATVRRGHAEDLPPELVGDRHRAAQAFFGVLGEALEKAEVTPRQAKEAGTGVDRRRLATDVALLIEERVLPSTQIVDWVRSADLIKDVEGAVDDALFDVRTQHGIGWSTAEIDQLLERMVSMLKKQAGG